MTAIHTTPAKLHIIIPIPEGAEIKISPNDQIKKQQTIAVRQPDQIKYDLALGLKTKPHKIDKLINKSIGDKVESGETLVETKSWFKSKKIISHIDGTISHYESGVMYVQVNTAPFELLSPVNGRVINIENTNLTVEIDTQQAPVHWGWGVQKWGELSILGKQTEDINLEQIKGNYSNKIVVVGGTLSKGLWHKISALGAIGIITNQIPSNFDTWSITTTDNEDSINLHHPSILVMDDTKTEKFADSHWSWFNNKVGEIAIINGNEKWLSITT